MATGTQLFTFLNLGKESTSGTSVNATREWYPDGTSTFDPGVQQTELRGNRGTRANMIGTLEIGELASVNYKSHPSLGMAWDEFTYLGSQLDGGNSGVGAGDDKVWTIAPSMTAANTPESYTAEVGDQNQCWDLDYMQMTDWTISAGQRELTQLEWNAFARRATKSTATSVAANQAIRIPSYLWKIRFATAQSGLAGASDESGLLVDFSINHFTGLTPRFYLEGVKYFTQSAESQEQRAEITLHVESQGTATSEFYDKFRAGTNSFMQLKATGPALGGTNYSAQMQFAVAYTSVMPISSELDGVNLWEVKAKTVFDPTWGTYFAGLFTNSIATIA